MQDPESISSKLNEIYSKIPEIKCRGKCYNSCGPILFSPMEEQRFADAGIKIKTTNHRLLGRNTCNQLTNKQQCAIYHMRPAICRLWGVVEKMKCQYGCKPKGGFLSEEQSRKILDEIKNLEV